MSHTPDFLKDALKFGINLGLQRMEALDELLGNPEKKLKVIHIAGTNGKGSVSSFLTHIMAASNLKVGVYTSPFLERFSERMRIIDGRDGLQKFLKDDSYGEINDTDLKRLSDMVQKCAEKLPSMGIENPTEFELVTAICYQWFYENNVDVVILETGLGGRLDSTNVITNPLCCAITSIGMDHSDRLGNTVSEIAYEKAGIFKNGCPIVCLEPEEMILTKEEAEDVRTVIMSSAINVCSQVFFVSAKDANIRYTSDGLMRFTLGVEDYVTRLLGDHQVSNAQVAITCARIAAMTFGSINPMTIKEGIALTSWKCRAEIISMDPVVMLDGGHNPQGARSLGEVWNKALGGKLAGSEVRFVMGAMKDKDIKGIFNSYHECNINISDAYFVKVDNPRTEEPAELSNIFKNVYNNLIDINVYDDPEEAVRIAFEKSKEDGKPLLITGSLYLMGQIRGFLRGIV